MSKVFGPIPFMALFLLINLPMTFLSNEPDSKCLGLLLPGPTRFNNMMGKLKISLEKSAYKDDGIWNDHDAPIIWNEFGAMNYSELLTEIKGLMAQLKDHSLRPVNLSQNFVNILGQTCGTHSFILVNRSITCENVLDEVLECADAVHEFITQNQKHTENAGEKLDRKIMWTNVDKNFERALQTIWVLYNKPYAECHKLVKSDKFTKMIEKLEKKIPIKKERNNDILDSKGKMNYDNLLSGIKSFISKMKSDKKIIPITEMQTYKVEYRRAIDGTPIAGSLMEEALECAMGMHEFTKNMKTLGIRGCAKLPKNDWTKVNEKFEVALQKIWKLEEAEDTNKMAVAQDVNNGPNAHVKTDKNASETRNAKVIVKH